jgi:hypothetical protein
MALRATHGDECQQVTFERAVALFSAVAARSVPPAYSRRKAAMLSMW